MNRFSFIVLIWFNCLLPSLLGGVSTDKELGLEVLWDLELERFRVFRPHGKAQIDFDSESGMYNMSLSFLAWMNEAADVENQLDQSRIEARSALFNFFFDSYLVSIGQMIVDWGETFGYRPSDLVNARDLRNFPPLDLDANKIPVTAMRFAGSLDFLQGEFIFSPLSSYPLLPKRLADGSTLRAPTRNESWFEQSEYGMKLGILLGSGNIDFYTYKHLNRIPILDLSSEGWRSHYEILDSFGLNSAFSFDSFVIRCDGLLSPRHPILVRAFSDLKEYDRYFSLTFGLDWSYEQVSLLGLQAHLERYPIKKEPNQKGISMQARHELSNFNVSLALSLYRGFIHKDHREEIKLSKKVGPNLDLSIGLERLFWVENSPIALTANSRSFTGKIAYQF
ncbi:MAG: hypothetical protein AB8G05_04005 [Oligoflexales bacterium]